MPAKMFKPLEIRDTNYPYLKSDGTESSFDPFDFWDMMQKVKSDDLVVLADAIRKFLGYPTSKDIADAPEDAKPQTIPLVNCDAIQADVMDFIAELPQTKKKQELSRKLSASASSPAS